MAIKTNCTTFPKLILKSAAGFLWSSQHSFISSCRPKLRFCTSPVFIAVTVKIVFGRWQEQTCWHWQVIEDVCSSSSAGPHLYLSSTASVQKASMYVVLQRPLRQFESPQLFRFGHWNPERHNKSTSISRVHRLRPQSELSGVLGQIRTQMINWGTLLSPVVPKLCFVRFAMLYFMINSQITLWH